MQGSFLEYAYSVIYSRALPDARDGLKPVQRRILYQMTEMGLRPDRGHVKSARVVGEVMGKLHPHGDTAIYDALVRMAQAFTLRVPLIDGHGNFGSLDDGPAAPRYTEARLAAPALAMTEGLDEDVVDFVPNYDNQLTQPEVLPAAYPNLLVNGASGIAVGMATNMAPHNLIEVVGGGPAPASRTRTPRSTSSWSSCPAPTCPPAAPSSASPASRTPTPPAAAASRPAPRCRVEQHHRPQDRARRHRAALPRRPREGHREDQGRRQRQEDQRHLRRHRPHRPQQRPAARHRHQDRLQPRGRARAALPAHAARGLLQHQQRRARRRRPADARPARAAAGLRRAPHLGRHAALAVPARAAARTPAPRRRPAHRDPRHRRGHPGHPRRATTPTRRAPASWRSSTSARCRPSTSSSCSCAASPSSRASSSRPSATSCAPRSPSSRRCSRAGTASRPSSPTSSPRSPSASARRAAPCSPTRGRASPAPRRSGRPPCSRSRTCRAACSSARPAASRASTCPTGADGPPTITPPARRSKHDAIRSTLDTTSRAEIGAVTSLGRLIRFTPVDLPDAAANVGAARRRRARSRDYLALPNRDEKVLAIVSLDADRSIALGTKQGVVKRVATGALPEQARVRGHRAEGRRRGRRRACRATRPTSSCS